MGACFVLKSKIAVFGAALLVVHPGYSAANAQGPSRTKDDLVVDTTPFLTVTKGTAIPGEKHNFCYFRLNVEPMKTGGPDDIPHTPRNWFGRLMRDVDYSFNSLLKVRAGLYEDTLILYSRKFRSTRKEGDVFDRTILVRGRDNPVFLLQRDSNGQAGISLTAEMKKSQNFQLAGAALEAVSLGLKAVSPASDIITTLTSDSTKAVAQKIDQGAGAFLGVAGNNGETFDLDITKGESLMVEVRGPKDEIAKQGLDEYLLGAWKVSFEPAFASYFHQDVGCAADGPKKAWDKVGQSTNLLSSELISNVPQIGTLSAYLKQLDWWTDGQKSLAGKSAGSPEAENFCRRIVDAVAALGFNSVDAYLAADAVSRSSLVGPAEGAAMRGSGGCKFVAAPPVPAPPAPAPPAQAA